MSGMLSDSKILQTLREKEPLGMDALFERYYRPLVVFAESYLHDLQSTEDLVQEQMVKLWSKQTFAGIVPEALGTFFRRKSTISFHPIFRSRLSASSVGNSFDSMPGHFFW